jgi:hypothetical protein
MTTRITKRQGESHVWILGVLSLVLAVFIYGVDRMPAAKNGWKLCPKCGETKRVSEFYKNKREKDGLNCYCKDCSKRRVKNYSQNNKKRNFEQGVRITKKCCLKCGRTKNAGEFYRDINKKDGLNQWCKACIKQYNKEHKEKRKKTMRKHRQKNKVNNLKTGIIITEKRCPKCGQVKSVDEFYKCAENQDGLSCWCKDCKKRDYRQKGRLQRCKRYREYKIRNLIEGITIKEKHCSKCGKIKNADAFYKNAGAKDGLSSWCKSCCQQYQQSRQGKNTTYTRQRRQKNKKTAQKYEREYAQRRRQTDPSYRLSSNISRAIRHALRSKGGSKQGRHWEDVLKYTTEDLKSHLESLFKDDMTWENYGFGRGKWVIDHIRPIASFSFISTNDPEFEQCWALENLQPLWWGENMRKGSRVD